MNEEQDSSTGGSITLFTLRSIYSSSEEEQIQFQFKAGNLEMIVRSFPGFRLIVGRDFVLPHVLCHPPWTVLSFFFNLRFDLKGRIHFDGEEP